MTVKVGYNVDEFLEKNLVRRKDVEELTFWLGQENLPKYSFGQIIQFLLSCDGVTAAAKRKIKAYVEITNSCDIIFRYKNLMQREDLQKFIKVVDICVMPKRTEDGCVIVFQSLTDTNYRNFEVGAYLTVVTMVLESVVYEYPAHGLIIIMDMATVSWKHLLRLRFGLVQIYGRYLLEACPMQLHKVYLINAQTIAQKLLSVIRPFIKAELLQKFVLYKPTEMESFYEDCLAQKFLPSDYGGEMPCLRTLQENQVKKLRDLTDYYEAEELQRKNYCCF